MRLAPAEERLHSYGVTASAAEHLVAVLDSLAVPAQLQATGCPVAVQHSQVIPALGGLFIKAEVVAATEEANRARVRLARLAVAAASLKQAAFLSGRDSLMGGLSTDQ